MEPLSAVDMWHWPSAASEPAGAEPTGGAGLRAYPTISPASDEPLAVITAGPSGADRRALLAGLLGVAPANLRVPPESFLVLRPAATAGFTVHVPGDTGGAVTRFPAPTRTVHPSARRTGSPRPFRPPRRVELSGPEPLLRHFLLVDTPDTDTLGVAGTRVVRDAVRRGGALLFVLPADRPVTASEVALLTETAGEAAIFLVGTPSENGTWPAAPDIEAQRAAIVRRVPALDGLSWLDLDPAAGDTAYLRRALIDWASTEGLRRASRTPPVGAGLGRTVRVAPTAATSGWADVLERRIRDCAQQLRREIALETANIHLRAVQEIVFGAGRPGLPRILDREVEALSLDVTAACDAELDRIIDELLPLVLGEAPDDGVRLRVAAAVAAAVGGADEGGDPLHRALLVRQTGEVVPVDGPAAVAAFASYPWTTAILPPIGMALAAECFGHWQPTKRGDSGAARSWLQQALREIELELCREVSRRLTAVGRSLAGVLDDAVRHGRLRA